MNLDADLLSLRLDATLRAQGEDIAPLSIIGWNRLVGCLPRRNEASYGAFATNLPTSIPIHRRNAMSGGNGR